MPLDDFRSDFLTASVVLLLRLYDVDIPTVYITAPSLDKELHSIRGVDVEDILLRPRLKLCLNVIEKCCYSFSAAISTIFPVAGPEDSAVVIVCACSVKNLIS